MTDTQRSIQAAIAVVVVATAFLGGLQMRDKADLGLARLASNDPGASLTLGRVADGAGANIGDRRYVAAIMDMLDRAYVDPVTDRDKLGSGAVRGMIGSLMDPESLFYEAEPFKRMLEARRGQYEGVGVVTRFELAKVETDGNGNGERGQREAAMLPRIVVAATASDGPAAKAGLQAGDVITGIDGKWVLNADDILQLRKLQQETEDPALGAAQKDAAQKRFSEARKAMVKQMEHSLMPQRAQEILTSGTEGELKLTWLRSGRASSAILQRGAHRVPLVKDGPNGLRFQFVPEALDELGKLIGNQEEVVLDLTQNAMGDETSVPSFLGLFGPKGAYGIVATEKDVPSKELTVKQGRADPLKVVIRVDGSTRGPAAVFARALELQGIATLVGKLAEAEPVLTKTVQLPDGSGYTLNIGRLVAEERS